MKRLINRITCQNLKWGFLCLLALSIGSPVARAGLTLEIDFYRDNQGQSYVFYTPLYTNAIPPAAALGTYSIYSPHQPTNGSWRQYQMTSTGLELTGGGEYGYGDFDSALQQITNGAWRILFTNATTTNLYTFTVSAPSFNSNMLPATIITFPADGSFVPTNEPTFTWQRASTWSVGGNVSLDNSGSFYEYLSLPAAQDSWTLPVPSGSGYNLRIQYVTNCTTPVLLVSTPVSTNASHLPISGWAFTNTLETGSAASFSVFTPGAPSSGHTNVAYYSFEDNSLFAQDFSGFGNDIGTYASFSEPPRVVTNHAAAGIYSVGFSGSGWLVPSTNLLSTLAGSFSVSLWLKTTNVFGDNNADIWNAAGIVSALTGSSNQVVPMAQTGSKLAFYTGGNYPNLLHSQTNINTGQYVHVVTTRDQQTGEKWIYINGVLDSFLYAGTELLVGPDELDIGYNNGRAFTGDMDEIQIYSGVLSPSEVAYLHANPGTRVSNTVTPPSGVHRLVGQYTFDNSGRIGQDFSTRGDDIDCGSGWGGLPGHTFSTNAVAGGGAIQFYGGSTLCVIPPSKVYTNWLATLGGSFSFSVWLKTTASQGSDTDDAIFGSTIFWAYNDHNGTNDTIPLAITGSKAAFSTRDHLGQSTTLHSTSTVNNGAYHHLVATRNVTGEMKLYVDGNLEGTEIGTPEPLNGNDYYLSIGGAVGVAYTGLLDEAQVYSGVLSSNDVAYLFHHPGSNVVDTTDQDFNTALNTTGLVWYPGGDTGWFVETTNANDSVSAAQTGSVVDYQNSRLSVTVAGPGTLSFYWSCAANDTNGGFYFEFDLDNSFMNSISGNNSWWQDGTFTIPPGQHTLSWVAYANGDTDPTQAGFLDQVNYVPNSPIALLNPQTIGSTFYFQFLSQAGLSHAVQYRTNLVTGTDWQTYGTVPGDGSMKNIPIPLSVFSPAKQGFLRISTH